MTLSSEQQSDDPSHSMILINCDGVMGIRDVSVIHQQLRDALHQARPVEIDAGDVERVDTAALQLLYAFLKKAQASGLSVTWKAVSETFQYSAQVINLGTHLELAQ